MMNLGADNFQRKGLVINISFASEESSASSKRKIGKMNKLLEGSEID